MMELTYSPYSLVDSTFSEDKMIEYHQQYKERGFDDTELWNLDNTICKFILPRLKRFKEIHMGYPAELDNDEEWIEILNEIIWAMEEYLKDNHNKRIQKGFELFGKYIIYLWD